ncbi:LamG domain-containing protein [Streptomyces sp. TR06-5]|uniref:LamG domain-containing protein n=1 Tax=Streptomyces sp. TR06-5 TaxID=3385976 RepID=UPI0039A125AB
MPATVAQAAAAEPVPASQAPAQAHQNGKRAGLTAPAAPNLSVAEPYQACEPNDCPSGGGPGVSATITVTPAEGGPVAEAHFRSPVTGEWLPMTKSGSGFTATFTPELAGLLRVSAYLVDKNGVAGPTADMDFFVAAGEGPVARWHFDETSGVAVDAATDADSARQDATLHAGATRDDRGRRGVITSDAQGGELPEPVTDLGMVLDGSGGYAATDGPVLATREAYTLSAWARLDSTDVDGAVLSQDGQRYSPFALRYDADLERWTFGVKESDADNGQSHEGVVADHAARVGVWTHLLGRYDPVEEELTFYVNGRVQGTSHVSGDWAANGDFQIGRELSEGEYRSSFHGSIDEVSVWQRALTATESADVASLTLASTVHNGAELVADWDPSAASGTTVTDTVSGYGHDLALAGGAALDDEALVLDGVDGHATVDEPIVDNTGSFTATADVELDPDALATAPVGTRVQVFEQPAADGTSWGLWFEVTGTTFILDEDLNEKIVPYGHWFFGREGAAVSSDTYTVLDGSEVRQRVTGVYDAPDGTIRLYLSLTLHDVPTAFTSRPGQGSFTVGASTAGDHLQGRVLDARIWAGAPVGRQQLGELIGE